MKIHHHLNFIQKYSRTAKKAVLSSAEKSDMKAELIRMNGISHPMSASCTEPAHHVPSPYAKYLKQSKKLVAPLVLVLIVGTGTSYAAESAVPGDLLYPVKIHVNENVYSGLSFSALSQAQWAVKKLQRRLQEVKELGIKAAAQAGLTTEVAAETTDANAKIAALDLDDPHDATQLSAQLDVLLDTDGTSTQPINVNLSTTTDMTSSPTSHTDHIVKFPNPIIVPAPTVAATATGLTH